MIKQVNQINKSNSILTPFNIPNDYISHHSSNATHYSRKSNIVNVVKDINHDSLGKRLKPLPQSYIYQHLENRHEEDKDIMKSPRIPHKHRNIESASKPFRENSFDAQSKVTGEGKIYRIILYLINSKYNILTISIRFSKHNKINI